MASRTITISLRFDHSASVRSVKDLVSELRNTTAADDRPDEPDSAGGDG